MSEPRFFKRPTGLTGREIMKLTGAVPRAGIVPDRCITGIAPLDRAGPGDLAFLHHSKYAEHFVSTHAGICLTTQRFAALAPAHVAILVTPAPYHAFVAVAQALYPSAMRPSSLLGASGISPIAQVHTSARLEAGVDIDPTAVVGPRAEIGARTIIGPGTVIGPDVRIGRDCAIGASANLAHALIGDRVIIHPGARIGQDGFGFLLGTQGHRKVLQVGRVIIQDDVEIGANSAIDRGAIRDTLIGEGTKIGNLVQIGHNCEIGRHCIIAAFTGVSGSVTVGDHVKMGGRVGIADNLTIGAGAILVAGTGLISNVPPGETWGGSPGRPWREWLRGVGAVERLARRGWAGKRATEESEE